MDDDYSYLDDGLPYPHLDEDQDPRYDITVTFKTNQARIEREHSKEYKEELKKRRQENETDYWAWYNDNTDRTAWDYMDLSEWEEED